MVQQAHFKIRVGVIVVCQHHIVLVRQNNRPFWVTPGGTLEHGETLAQCAVRELQEELALPITLGPLFWVGEFLGGKVPAIDMVFSAQAQTQAVAMTPDENLNDVQWVSHEALANLLGKEAFQPRRLGETLLSQWNALVTNPLDTAFLHAVYSPDVL